MRLYVLSRPKMEILAYGQPVDTGNKYLKNHNNHTNTHVSSPFLSQFSVSLTLNLRVFENCVKRITRLRRHEWPRHFMTISCDMWYIRVIPAPKTDNRVFEGAWLSSTSFFCENIPAKPTCAPSSLFIVLPHCAERVLPHNFNLFRQRAEAAIKLFMADREKLGLTKMEDVQCFVKGAVDY